MSKKELDKQAESCYGSTVIKISETPEYLIVSPQIRMFGSEIDQAIFWARMLTNEKFIWWMELSNNVTPVGYIFYRKAKSGKWETVLKITDTTDKRLAISIFKAMMMSESNKFGKHAAMKVTSLNGRQIYSSYYAQLYETLSHKFSDNEMFGISINKGEEYLMFHPTLQEDSIKTISSYFYKLSGKHNGIKSFRKAKTDERDGNLYWGWLIFNDGYKISVALDPKFELYNQYKHNLKSINLSHLIAKNK